MTTIAQTVREIALNQPSSIRVFERYGIDYCCGGRKALAEACLATGVEVEAVIAALESAARVSVPAAEDWQQRSMEEITVHIVTTHHAYVRRELPRLALLAEKVVDRHGAARAELPAIQAALAQLDKELIDHLAKEEAVLFPYIVQSERASAKGAARPATCFDTVARPIAMMTQEHDAAGALMATMRRLSSDFTAPEDACPTYRAFYDGLKEFEQDLHQHIHLENNILFPRALQLESSADGPR
jgi:regulator of cell morphogenesis and NO signaling